PKPHAPQTCVSTNSTTSAWSTSPLGKASFLSPNMKDSQFLETRQFQVVDLARIWGVPPHLIFDLGKATFSNIEQQSLEFVIYHMGPHYERVGQALTKLFGRENHYFEHLTDALVKGDLKSRMEAYWLQRQMGMANANELRAKENQPNVAGDAGTEYWRPSNMAPAGRPAPSEGEAE
ncbi:phage portal protein, partial [Synechococcus sp. YX-04-1]|uniref:phage portal protein n=1 Tax=Synechococcus sp. YX-04-1 TaxID=3062778 RepID=UPI0026E46DE2